MGGSWNPPTISALAAIFGSLTEAGRRTDPLREFSSICRAELEAMHKELR
jgi:hypothetical protein